MTTSHEALDRWIDDHFDEEVAFLQALVRVPTDTPPGNNAPHAETCAQLLEGFGFAVERHAVPADQVKDYGMESITNLIVRRRYGEGGRTIGLNAHGDVVPPGDGWTHDPYGAEIVDGKLYGRAAAVSKSDFASYAFAVRALEAVSASQGARPGSELSGGIELIFTYDEEFGGELGPGWLLGKQLLKADSLLAAGFSYQVITAHNGCLQLEVSVNGKMAHAAIPATGIDALQGAVTIMNALYGENLRYRAIRSSVDGIDSPYLNIGRIEGGTNTNVVPGKVVFKLDRRMIPEEDPAAVEADVRRIIAESAASYPGITVDIRRLLLAHAWRAQAPDASAGASKHASRAASAQGPAGKAAGSLVQTLQKHGEAVFGEPIPALGTPLYTDVRLFGQAGIEAAIYGAGPRTVLESNAKRADEHLLLEDLRRATKVVARTLLDLLTPGS